MKSYDTIIIGSGAAGAAAAIYARRYEMTTVLIMGAPGGETAIAGYIENYPGFLKVEGYDLMERMLEQAKALGTETVEGEAELINNRAHCFTVQVGGKSYQGKTLILAMGMERRTLGLQGEAALKGKGVQYCVTCDGPLFKGKTVAVVGGGDSAVKGAYQLVDMGANHVYLIVREEDIDRAEAVNRTRLTSKGKKVDVLFGTEVAALTGKTKLASVTLSKEWNGSKTLPVEGLFVEIGAVPRSELPKELGVRFDTRGQVDVDPRTMQTSVPGVFAAGDITNASGRFKQIVTGAAQGSIAATGAYDEVQEHPNVCELHAVPVGKKGSV